MLELSERQEQGAEGIDVVLNSLSSSARDACLMFHEAMMTTSVAP